MELLYIRKLYMEILNEVKIKDRESIVKKLKVLTKIRKKGDNYEI